ncbi:hypothetical protein Tco_1180386 [Tanacetum coccineum]
MAKANTVNGECQLQALIDKKEVIIKESSIRSDLHLEDARGTDCLPTTIIFEELARMGAKSTAWNKSSSTMASLIICLATKQKFNLSKYIFDAIVKHLDVGVKFLMYPRFLQVLDLEKAKDAQAKEIADLKKRVQKVESSKDKDSLGDHEESSKQGRSIEDIDKDANVSLVDDTQRSVKEREVNTSVEDSAAPTTIEEITLAQTLIQIKAAKRKVVTTAATITTTIRPNARGVIVQEPSEFRTLQESRPSMIKNKGKAIMIEPGVPLKRNDRVALDEDLARNLQA